MPTIAENLHHIQKRIDAACKRAGRDPASVQLVAVSKKKPEALIVEAYQAGQRCFGENYAQELRDKAKALAGYDIDWHFIGRLQKNKAKYVAPVAAMAETIDSPDTALALAAKLPAGAPALPCLIEVNIGGEGSKSGVPLESVLPLARELIAMERIALKGLMTIPPFQDDPEQSRPFFRELRVMSDRLGKELGLAAPLQELSMGMSHDFEIAIEESATIVRVGTAIFGERT